MKVKAAAGVNVPMEGSPRKYITDVQEQEVPASAYYRRRIAEGDLVVVGTTAAAGKSSSTSNANTSSPAVARGVASEA
ncbi:DUF2635 domain-containing protein [Paraburkholderia unamae]|uniref:Uncharacterized protein DUF2635 n=1 Tax=Paraburkholderia unamae TaxID=219649 RepID=A0ABX5KI90_9BURK|nr:DUF2635 domain-containing protein [Paraburkholderia unamae]PVX80052.1 uncharacterized protein DUF2635 [Paraburkholderia unamae]